MRTAAARRIRGRTDGSDPPAVNLYGHGTPEKRDFKDQIAVSIDRNQAPYHAPQGALGDLYQISLLDKGPRLHLASGTDHEPDILQLKRIHGRQCASKCDKFEDPRRA